MSDPLVYSFFFFFVNFQFLQFDIVNICTFADDVVVTHTQPRFFFNVFYFLFVV